MEEKIEKALEIIFNYGQADGEHHKAWVIDQVVRALTGDKYNEWIKNYMFGELDPTEAVQTGEYYEWDKGIAP